MRLKEEHHKFKATEYAQASLDNVMYTIPGYKVKDSLVYIVHLAHLPITGRAWSSIPPLWRKGLKIMGKNALYET